MTEEIKKAIEEIVAVNGEQHVLGEVITLCLTEIDRIYQVLNEVSGNNYSEGKQDFLNEVEKTLKAVV